MAQTYDDITKQSDVERSEPLLQGAPPPMPTPPQTPDGWRAIWDYAHGRYYFMNASGEASWQLPPRVSKAAPNQAFRRPVQNTPQANDHGGGAFCLPPAEASATAKSKEVLLKETREMLTQPPVEKASTSKQIAYDLGLVRSKEGADYSDFLVDSKFVARTLADISEGGGTTKKESVILTGGVRGIEAESAKMFQDLANGPPPAAGKKTVEQLKKEDEVAAFAVERRHGRIVDIDRRCTALNTGGQQIDFSRADPWDWWKRGVLLEGEVEVFSMRLTGAIGMPSTGQVSEIFGKGCLMLTKTPMERAAEGKKLIVIKSGTTSASLVGNNSRESTAMEIREVDKDTDLMVFGSDGELQTREGRYFGADKTGRRGFTYRLHFVMQRDTAALDASEQYHFHNVLTRPTIGPESEVESERVESTYGSKHKATLVASVIEGAEDNLLHAFLDLEDSAELKVSTKAETEFTPLRTCPWLLWMFLKYGLATVLLILSIIVAVTAKTLWLIAVGAVVWVGWLFLLFAHLCTTGGTRQTDKWYSWAARTFFTASHNEVLSEVRGSERANVKVDFHPLRDEEAHEPLCGAELTASVTRSVHVLQLRYREKRTGLVRECKAVVDKEVKLEALAQGLSLLSDLAEWADQTKGLGATLHGPTAAWASTRAGLQAAGRQTSHIGSDLTGGVGGVAGGSPSVLDKIRALLHV